MRVCRRLLPLSAPRSAAAPPRRRRLRRLRSFAASQTWCARAACSSIGAALVNQDVCDSTRLKMAVVWATSFPACCELRALLSSTHAVAPIRSHLLGSGTTSSSGWRTCSCRCKECPPRCRARAAARCTCDAQPSRSPVLLRMSAGSCNKAPPASVPTLRCLGCTCAPAGPMRGGRCAAGRAACGARPTPTPRARRTRSMRPTARSVASTARYIAAGHGAPLRRAARCPHCSTASSR